MDNDVKENWQVYQSDSFNDIDELFNSFKQNNDNFTRMLFRKIALNFADSQFDDSGKKLYHILFTDDNQILAYIITNTYDLDGIYDVYDAEVTSEQEKKDYAKDEMYKYINSLLAFRKTHYDKNIENPEFKEYYAAKASDVEKRYPEFANYINKDYLPNTGKTKVLKKGR